MGVRKNPAGPLITSVLHRIDDVFFWSQTRTQPIAPADDDVAYLVKIADRLDLIAARLLGNEQLGWIILERNNLRLVPNDLVPGMTIYVPTRESLRDRGIIS